MKVEVVSGVNLPMLIKLPFFTNSQSLEEAAKSTMEYGKRNISVASQRLYNEES
jgi:mannose/fructose-specific phosphotransferase system component IIA